MSITTTFATSPISWYGRYEPDLHVVPKSPLPLARHVQTPSTKKISVRGRPLKKTVPPVSCEPPGGPGLSTGAKALLRKFSVLSEAPDLLKSTIFTKAVRFLTQGVDEDDETPELIKMFKPIGPCEYKFISLILESNVFERNPRLTYAASEGLLIIEMPRTAHEVPLSELNRTMTMTIEQLPYNRLLIRPSIEMNLSLQSSSGDFDATPDMAILLSRRSGMYLEHEVVFLAECAFSQGEEELIQKLQLEVDAHPEVVMVIMIIIDEADPYRSPKENSTAWHTFRRFPECTSFIEFVRMMQTTDEDYKWLRPVTVADHAWCRISSVNYHVWVKDGEKINIFERDGPTTTCGTLFPQGDMQTVDAMISDGLMKIRDTIISYSERLDPNANTNSLATIDIPWMFDWERCQSSMESGAERTAHERFRSWYRSAFRGTKRSIEDVEAFNDPVDTTSTSGPSQRSPPRTRSRSRAAKACLDLNKVQKK